MNEQIPHSKYAKMSFPRKINFGGEKKIIEKAIDEISLLRTEWLNAFHQLLNTHICMNNIKLAAERD